MPLFFSALSVFRYENEVQYQIFGGIFFSALSVWQQSPMTNKFWYGEIPTKYTKIPVYLPSLVNTMKIWDSFFLGKLIYALAYLLCKTNFPCNLK